MRVGIFFDGKNFYSGWRDKAEGRKIDFRKLAEWMVRRVGGARLWGVHYYTGIETGVGAGSEAQKSLSGFLDMLERQPGFFVHRFPRKMYSTICGECGSETHYTQEKEVDTSMVADMLRFASVAAFDTMVLVSGDADYAPAVEGVHALGKQAYVATWGGTGLSHRLRKISFDHIDMLDGLHLFEAEKHSDNQDDRGREGDESAAQTFVEELERAEQKFSGSYVGLSYFVTRWRSNTLTAAPDMRRRLLDQLIDEDRIEVYDAQDGSKAIRLS